MKFEKKIKTMFTGVKLKPEAKVKRAKRQLENVIWHIDVNGAITGSEQTLKEVRESLKTIADEL